MTRITNDYSVLYQGAVDDLRDGSYQLAEQKLLNLIQMGAIDSNVFHALGNSYYRQGHFNKAYGAYVEGLLLEPRNNDLQTNLSILETHLDSEPLDLGIMTMQEWGAVTGLFGTIVFLLILFGKGRLIRSLSMCSMALMIISLFFCWTEWSRFERAVVVQQTYSRSMIEKGVELYSLNVGEQVTILERNKGYWLVEHPSHGTGWLTETTIVLCNPYINKKR
jgi:hypothetical protein